MTKPKNVRQNKNEVEDCVILMGEGLMYLKTLKASISAGPLHTPLSETGFHVAQVPNLPVYSRRTLNSSSLLSPPPKC